MTYKLKVCIAKGESNNPTPPYDEFRQLVEWTCDDSINSIEELDRDSIVNEMEKVCCTPTMLVTGSWGTPYECPSRQLSERSFRTYKRYDWPNLHSLWMCVEIQA